jgi:formylglycine-generating enzyme required for sulfatase activity
VAVLLLLGEQLNLDRKLLEQAEEEVKEKRLPKRYDWEPEMIHIPAGKFWMGSNPKDEKAWDDERPQHRLYLLDYYLAKTPVTNAQYAVFVRATGHELPSHWEGGKIPDGKDDHPVVYVSWHDAVAYCSWLAEATGRPYRLPSEAEWEKGARGTDGRIYPWGNVWDKDKCNTSEGNRGSTTPVGAYPQGASPYGLLDMSGNVWEWTSSLWGTDFFNSDFKYPYDPKDGRENLQASDKIRRVLRGGAFLSSQKYARCASRNHYNPISRFRYDGFRVAAAPFSPDSGL